MFVAAIHALNRRPALEIHRQVLYLFSMFCFSFCTCSTLLWTPRLLRMSSPICVSCAAPMPLAINGTPCCSVTHTYCPRGIYGRFYVY
ncbi:hypothetical protein DFH08DRAFT_877572 [Mycena albidolilacea]|uniref:Uncharacterized protein n=1 Tax=Mycena albidolilacea TaxID=1033008 RepID=A0AAD6ZSA1_9AGAR|nr:hypothetical protein DFH08DRAFT_877572 [Mycena albidolilacea]